MSVFKLFSKRGSDASEGKDSSTPDENTIAPLVVPEEIFQAKREAILSVSGPHLRKFMDDALREKRFEFCSKKIFRERMDTTALDALSPTERTVALFDCLRVSNFISRCGARPSNTVWPSGTRCEIDVSDFPHIRQFSDLRGGWKLLECLFHHLIRRKVALDEAVLCEFMILMRSGVAGNLLRSLKIISLVEKFSLANPSARLLEEITLTAKWLEQRDEYWNRTFKSQALPRLEALVVDLEASVTSASPTASPASVSKPGELAALPVPENIRGNFKAAIEFYGDLGDLRKCTNEHLAVIDELIERDADPMKDHREWLEKEVADIEANGASKERAQSALFRGIFGAKGHAPGTYRKRLEQIKRRMETAASFNDEVRRIWPGFHIHARKLSGKSKASKAWVVQAQKILSELSVDDRIGLLEKVADGYPLSRQPDATDDAIRGLIIASGDLPGERVGPIIADFARRQCFVTVPGEGIQDKRMGNACLKALADMPEGTGVVYLARLLGRIKYPSVRKIIDAALNEAASREGISRPELDELSVPAHDLIEGEVQLPIGEEGGAAILRIVGPSRVALTFKAPGGQEKTVVPHGLKPFRAEIRNARTKAKEVAADLVTQGIRLQRVWLENRDWSYEDWIARYARHPLLSQLARRLIWTVSTGSGDIPVVLDAQGLADIGGHRVDAHGGRISLWHPTGRRVEEILGWRERLVELNIVQPFKQAHREVYSLTEAERTTRTYSNRFAGHILKQHQMMNLARLNDWSVAHRIWADVPNDEPTRLYIPAWNLIAEFWTQGAGGETPEVSSSQAYLYISTDQVRFYETRDGTADWSALTGDTHIGGDIKPLEEVPEIVFSEVMRHIDLFTSVASVANDPHWVDAGEDASHPNQWRREVGRQYWTTHAFGGLANGAESRREILREILPALKIAEKCRIDGNFLRVEGKVRAYKIHIGSGNILLEPECSHICILPKAAGNSGSVMLPFEGDSMLSLILSKAITLAADNKITDKVILRQISR